MNIRAHHLLCMRYFKGKGYSKRFVNNFYNVIRRLKKNPTIKIINYSDVICNPCPHNKNGKCIKKASSEEKVRKRDNIVIKNLGIKKDQKIRFNKVSNLINLKLDKIRAICRRCEWRRYCD